MPQLFRIGSFTVYFWANENMPLEPIHVHIASGKPQKDATKIWLTQAGHCVLANNRSKIPENILKNIMRMIEANWEYIREEWLNMFGDIRYYC